MMIVWKLISVLLVAGFVACAPGGTIPFITPDPEPPAIVSIRRSHQGFFDNTLMLETTWFAPGTQKEFTLREALNDYQTGFSDDINRVARNTASKVPFGFGEPPQRGEYTEEKKYQRELLYWNQMVAINLVILLAPKPFFELSLFRGITGFKNMIDVPLERLERPNQFLSTSSDIREAQLFQRLSPCCVIRLEIPKGYPNLSMTVLADPLYTQEQEQLLPFRVLNASKRLESAGFEILSYEKVLSQNLSGQTLQLDTALVRPANFQNVDQLNESEFALFQKIYVVSLCESVDVSDLKTQVPYLTNLVQGLCENARFYYELDPSPSLQEFLGALPLQEATSNPSFARQLDTR